MYELSYYSIARKDLLESDIAAILDTARHFNAKHNITGCLLSYNSQFIQVLEGDKTMLEELFNKIKNDKRHFNVTLLAESEKQERTFNTWSMAYSEIATDQMSNLGDTLFENNFLTFSELANKPTRVIRSFWNRAQRLILEKNL